MSKKELARVVLKNTAPSASTPRAKSRTSTRIHVHASFGTPFDRELTAKTKREKTTHHEAEQRFTPCEDPEASFESARSEERYSKIRAADPSGRSFGRWTHEEH